IWHAFPKNDEVEIKWSGSCEAGLASGSGQAVWYVKGAPSSWNQGTRKAGRPIDGPYTMGRPDGTEFRGNIVNGWASGQGRYVTSGRVYEGNWKEGCFEEGGRWAWFSATEIESDCIRRLKQKN